MCSCRRLLLRGKTWASEALVFLFCRDVAERTAHSATIRAMTPDGKDALTPLTIFMFHWCVATQLYGGWRWTTYNCMKAIRPFDFWQWMHCREQILSSMKLFCQASIYNLKHLLLLNGRLMNSLCTPGGVANVMHSCLLYISPQFMELNAFAEHIKLQKEPQASQPVEAQCLIIQ
jgi:hypothetical protein